MSSKVKKECSAERMAQDFWIGWYQKSQRLIEETLKGDNCKNQLNYIKALKKLPADNPVGSIDQHRLQFKYLVKPNLDWNKIRACLSEIHIEKKGLIENLIFILKPFCLDEMLFSNPLSKKLDEAADRVCRDCNKQIKEKAPLVAKLKKLSQQDAAYAKFAPLQETIEALCFDLELAKAIVRRKRSTEKKLFREVYGLDKNMKLSPQKHKLWNELIPPAIGIINRFCHTDNCESDCRKTHEKAINKVAELLKILHPGIWKEDVETISKRIKQKEYRSIS